MDEKNNPRYDGRTAWHPLLVFAMEHLAPANRKVLPEYPLSRLPQRVDIVVIEQADVPAAPVRKLRRIFDHTKKRTLIEYKGVTDDLEPSDVFVLLGYACQYMTMNDVNVLGDMCLMVMADRIPASFVARLEQMRGTFESVGNGLWRGELAGLSLHGVELREAYKTGPSERLLYIFTRAFLRDPGAIFLMEGLDEEDVCMYNLLYQHVHQLRRDPATMNLKDMSLIEQNMARFRKDYFAHHASMEERFEGLTPEEVLAGFTPEQRFAGLTPEQRFAGLTPEQRFAGLTPEQIAAALPPEALEYIARKVNNG